MPTARPFRITPAIWAALIVLYLVWGSTYLGIRIAVETIPPFLMAGARFLVAGALLLAWSILREGRTFRPPSRREWRDTLIVASLLLGGGMGMVAWGEQTVPSGIAALLVAMMPVWIAVLGRIFLGERLPRVAMVGVTVGFVGVAILVGVGTTPTDRLDPAGVAALIVSPISWATGSLYAAHRAALPSRPLVATGAQMVAGGLVLVLMGVVTGEPWRLDIPAISTESLIAVAYLTIIGSIVGFTAYGWLLRVAPLPLISTYAYVNPIVAVILGGLVLSEPLTPRTVVAGAVIVFAVALIITARSRMQGPRRAQRAPAVEDEAAGGRPAVSPPPGPSAPRGARAPSR